MADGWICNALPRQRLLLLKMNHSSRTLVLAPRSLRDIVTKMLTYDSRMFLRPRDEINLILLILLINDELWL